MKKFSLLKNFTIFSSIAFLITGTFLVIIISRHMQNDELQKVRDLVVLAVDSILKPEFVPDDFEKPLPESRKMILDQRFDQIMKLTNITCIFIWNQKRVMLYASDQNYMNRYKENDNNFILALDNNINYYISKENIEKNENKAAKYIELIHIYAPIIYNNKTVGIFEVHKPYAEIREHISSLNTIIAVLMFSGLLFLYIFLIKVIYNASRTLVSQNESLKIQKKELEESYLKLNSSYKSTIIALSNAVDARDPYTAGHSERVTKIALEIGQNMGLSSKQLETLELAALFHDIGKIGVPDNILLKPDKLTNLEFEKIKEHPAIGVNILKDIDFLKNTFPIILHHHEKYSGGGYPYGIKGVEIPAESRIITVADAYDAMTSDRPYRKALTHEQAIDELIKLKGIQFDSNVVETFLKIESTSIQPVFL